MLHVQRLDFKVAPLMAFCVLHGLAPPYLNQLVRVSDLPGRHRLRCSSSQLHACAAVPTHNRRSTLLSSRCITPMELTANWHSLISIPTCFPSTSKNISFSTIISWFCIVTLLRLCGLRNSSAILDTLKNFDWHWHWHWHTLGVHWSWGHNSVKGQGLGVFKCAAGVGPQIDMTAHFSVVFFCFWSLIVSVRIVWR